MHPYTTTYSLAPKPVFAFNNLKRKRSVNYRSLISHDLRAELIDSFEAPATNNKKAKKVAKPNNRPFPATDHNEQLALNRRAERFQREHELEKTKHTRNQQATTPPTWRNNNHPQGNGHLKPTARGTRSSSMRLGSNEPEGNPVS